MTQDSKTKKRVSIIAAIVTVLALIGVMTALIIGMTKPTPVKHTAAPKPTATATTAPDEATALPLACNQVLTQDQLDGFNPNYVPSTVAAPQPYVDLASLSGEVTCSWHNPVGGDILTITVAKPSKQQYGDLQAQASVNGLVSVVTYGDPAKVKGFFRTVDGVGEAQIFTDGYWIVLTSTTFGIPSDAVSLPYSVQGNLPTK